MFRTPLGKPASIANSASIIAAPAVPLKYYFIKYHVHVLEDM
jgi:hypothetical protein